MRLGPLGPANFMLYNLSPSTTQDKMPRSRQRRRGPIRVLTDCTGMETFVLSLLCLGARLEHIGASEIDAHARKLVSANFKPKKFWKDIKDRDNTTIKDVDIYGAGFPCTPYSTSGRCQGPRDPRSGVAYFVVRTIVEVRPTLFVLENVAGLVSCHEEVLMWIINEISQTDHYNLYLKIINTNEHGIPQSRPRLYIIGLAKKQDRGTFKFPDEIGHVGMSEILDGAKRAPTCKDVPPASQTTACRNFLQAMGEIVSQGLDPFKEPCIADLDSTKVSWKHNMSPCLTRTRGGMGGFWVTCRGRRFTVNEMLRLQGVSPRLLNLSVVSSRQMGLLCGNAMSCNVLERILFRALPAVSLAEQSHLLPRWETLALARATIADMHL